jgi:general secretion pathway protein C
MVLYGRNGTTMKRLAIITGFFLFIALCVSASYWVMQLFRPPSRLVASTPPTSLPAPEPGAAADLFGGRSSTVAASSFQLKGVVMASNPDESVAIVAVNGKPPRPRKTHEDVVPGVTIKEINRGYVTLSDGGMEKRVNLPPAVKPQGIGNPSKGSEK